MDKKPADSSDRRQLDATAAALERANSMIIEIEEVARLGRWHWELAGNRFDASERLFHIYGLEPGTPLTQENFIQKVKPEDRDRVEDTIRAVIEEKKPRDEKFQIVLSNGDTRWIYVRARPELDANGHPTGMVGTAQDITEQEQTEAELRRSERLFREMADHIREVFWLFDVPSQKVIYASPAYETIWRRRVTDLYNRYEDWSDSIHPDDHEKAVKSFERLIEDGGGDVREYRIIQPDGQVRWIADRGFVIRNSAQEVVRVVGIAEDVTDRKKEEEERSALQAKMQHSQKLESLGVMAGGIAHDFNNLLMAIMGNADLALSSLSSHDSAREYVQKIAESSQQAAGLTNQMLAYSGMGNFEIQPLYLNQLIDDMIRLLDTVISKKAVIQVVHTPELPMVKADESQLRQIVMNLVLNGSESLDGESGVLTVKTGFISADRAYLQNCFLGDEVEEGTYAYFEVSDTGSGMSGDTLGKIFDPFYTTKFTGRGLGLAAVLGIVRSHKGAIEVHSGEGTGSAFRVLLPTATKEVEKVTPPLEATEPAAANTTILIAEDDTAVLEVASKMLTNAGFIVLKAVDGDDAVKQFREHKDTISLVILDMTMPVLDGEEAFTAIRDINPNIRIIITSGYSQLDVANRFEGRGLNGFIQKPYRSSGLLASVTEVLSDEVLPGKK